METAEFNMTSLLVPADQDPSAAKPGLEKSDSCYDSDDHDEDNADVPRNVRNFENAHRNVSRTVSETLKEEYDHDGLEPDRELYKSHLAFALKLGYTEQQVQKALRKLGTLVTENAFLAELISLGASATDDEVPVGVCRLLSTESPLHRRQIAKCANNPSANDASSFLRHIVIDGSNVAMSHGNKSVFSCRGIQLCVDYFRQRGHVEITVFVPQWRKEASKPDAPIKDQEILLQLERDGMLTFTPSRYVGSGKFTKRLVCYDDRYIIKLAMETEGIIVSNDAYRDLVQENMDYRKVVESHLLMYSFVNDRFMPPDDPLGRHGPTLSQFLRKNVRPIEYQSRPCPYGKKCTYGNKCKFAHPERGNQPQKSVTEMISERARIQLQEIKEREQKSSSAKQKLTATLSSPVRPSSAPHRPISRTRSMVPGSKPDSPTYPRTLSPLATTSVSCRYVSVSPPAPLSAYHNPSTTDETGLVDHVVGNFDRMFVGEENFLARRMNQQPRFFSGNEGNSSFPSQRANQPINHSYAGSFLQPRAYETENCRMHLGNSHRPLAQTHSDPFAAPPPSAGGHGKLQRKLSLNPYASQSLSDTSQFFKPDRNGSEQNFFRPGGAEDTFSAYMADSAAKAESFFGHQRLVPQDNFLTSSTNSMFHDTQRIDLFDRLSSLFPEEKVRYAMTCYPQEYNAEKLCAAILKIFPAHQDR